MLIKNSSITFGNQTRKLSACSALPQPPATPRTPENNVADYSFSSSFSKCMIYAVPNMIKIGIRDGGVFLIDQQQKDLLLRVDPRAIKVHSFLSTHEMAKLI